MKTAVQHRTSSNAAFAGLGHIRPGWDMLIILLAALPAVLPLLRDGYPHTVDGNLHLLRIVLLDHHVSQGVLYPRWTPELFLGYGYPVFHFYAPAAYYLSLLFHWLGANEAQALVAVFALLPLVGGVGMYRLAADIFADHAPKTARASAIVAAVAMIYAPYLLTNIYVRGAVAELGAQALFPWIFWSFRGLFRGERAAPYFLPAVLSLGLLALTHNISLLFVPPILLIYLLLLWWTGGDRNGRSRLKWVAAAGLTAVAISTFFWLPLIAERQFLADFAYERSLRRILQHAWTWSNFLDRTMQFSYDSDPPFQLGLVQVLLAAVGFLAARRRDAEWLFWMGVAVVGAVCAGRWADALWKSSDILLIAQFPWRLLSIITPALAILAGGLVSKVRNVLVAGGVAVMVVGVIVWAQTPRSTWLNTSIASELQLTPEHATHYEAEIGALGTSSTREFLPRWVETLSLPEPLLPVSSLQTIQLQQASDFEMQLAFTTSEPVPLRWTHFYFPGWRVTLADGTVLAPYPSTPLGLLTVDVPAGAHEIRLSWHPTRVQQIGALISVLAWFGLMLGFARHAELRRWAAVPAVVFVSCVVVLLWPAPDAQPVQAPAYDGSDDAVQMLGYQATQETDGRVLLHAYWFVRETPEAFQPVWILEDSDGNVVSMRQADDPYLGKVAAQSWPANSVVDDLYTLFIPENLSGSYQLRLAASANAEAQVVGWLDLTTVGAATPPQPSDAIVQYGNIFYLHAYELAVNGRVQSIEALPIIKPGDHVMYTLLWQRTAPSPVNYHATLQLTDANWRLAAQKDHILGSPFNFPQLWNPFRLSADTYRIRIPRKMQSGVYWPRLALYDFSDRSRLALATVDNDPLGDIHTLAPIKVVNNGRVDPQVPVAATFGETANLLGYSLEPEVAQLQAGDSLTVTLMYEGLTPSAVEFKQFVHLRNPELGMAAQADMVPQDGNNPTTSWQPGEVIQDSVPLTVANDVKSGVYTLFVGFYNPQDGTRLPVILDGDGPQADNQLLLFTVEIEGND